MSSPKSSGDLLTRARAFADADPDPTTRAELEALIARAPADAAALADLEDRFAGPLEFGTAGLRGLIGAGENRMNRAVVLRATYGLLQHVLATVPDARARGLVLGRDARRGSDVFQRDAAEVALALGFRVHFIGELSPTPVVAFGVLERGAAVGVAITASHNPPDYNGYKVYWGNGAQIIPPHDAQIAREIAAAPRASEIPRVDLDRARAGGSEGFVDATPLIARYVEATSELRVVDAPVERLVIAYTALHGVGEKTFRQVLTRRGFVHLHSVSEQAEPDGTFPTTPFPNPEEPGALDRVLELARNVQADVVLANDPDADRLAVAARRGEAYVVLNGNEIGVLLGHHVLTRGAGSGPERLVLATIVSSQLLRRIAEVEGARYAETLTGFKWIANEALALEAAGEGRFVFGYEEALGYTVGRIVRDKDGIGAGLVMAELAAQLKSEGKTLLDALEHIWRKYGLLLSRQKSVTLPGREGRARIEAVMARFRAGFVPEIGGERVASAWDLKARTRVFADGREETVERQRADVFILDLVRGGRVAVRPSGTEPKIKFYLEVSETVRGGEALDEARARGQVRLDHLLAATLAQGGL